MEAGVKLVFDILAFSSIMVLVVAGLAVIASLMGIFNLGHGILPETPIGHVEQMLKQVRRQ